MDTSQATLSVSLNRRKTTFTTVEGLADVPNVTLRKVNERTDELKPTMGILSSAALGVGLMIGSGIFSTPGSVLNLCGSVGMTLVLYSFGGISTFFGGLGYIELGSMFPKNGGTQQFLGYTWPSPRLLLSYLFSFTMIVCIRPGAIAANGPVVAKYFIYAAVGCNPSQCPPGQLPANIAANYDWIARGIGWAVITLLTLINIFSTRAGVWTNNLLTLCKISVLSVIIITGFVALGGGFAGKYPNPNTWNGDTFNGTSNSVSNYAFALNKVYWAYDGWTNLSYSLGELENPTKNLPISMTLAIIGVSILYILVIVSYFTVVPADVAKQSKEILAAVYSSLVFGPGNVFGTNILPAFIGLSVMGAVAAQIFGVSRIIHAAAHSNYLPYGSFFQKLDHRLGTPVYALLLNYILTMIWLFAPPPDGVFDFLVDAVQWSTWLFYGIAVLGVTYLRIKYPNWPRPFRSWYPLTWLFIAVCIFICVLPFVPTSTSSSDYWLSPVVGVGVVILGIFFWYPQMVWWPNKKSKEHDKVMAWLWEDPDVVPPSQPFPPWMTQEEYEAKGLVLGELGKATLERSKTVAPWDPGYTKSFGRKEVVDELQP